MRIDSGTIVAVLAVLSFLFACAGIIGSWRVSRNTTALTQYRETAKAWEGRSTAQEAEIGDLKKDIATLTGQMRVKDQQNAELDGKVQVLQDTLTGKASWDILERKIGEALQLAADSRTEAREMHERTMQNQEKILGLLTGKTS